MQNSSILTKLPTELLGPIIEAIPSYTDQKSLRLTCHVFNTHTTPWLFRDIRMHVFQFLGDVTSFKELVGRYGRYVQTLDIDDWRGRSESLCPFEVAPFLDRMPRLQKIKMHGAITLSCWGIDPVDEFIAALLRASLYTPPAERILTHLHSLTLEVWQQSDEDVFFEDLSLDLIFIIPSLREIYLTDVTLCATDPQLPGLQERPKTNLSTLCIRSSYIDINAIKNILAFPRELTRLELQSRPPFTDDRPEGWSEETRTLADLSAALAQQSESLEILRIQGELPLTEAEGKLDLSRFPRLGDYSGPYKDSSGCFK